MHTKIGKLKKISIIILTILVSLLVIYALYVSKSRFYNPEIVMYSQITIDETNDINDVISKYSDRITKDRFISEVKKVNNLSSLNNESVYGKTLYIPLIKN
ncbi:MAG: hypothetical protein M1308_21250 [Actinobacteria bacterium]|nr:hypothetical protein [Actinomycetota bacterium]